MGRRGGDAHTLACNLRARPTHARAHAQHKHTHLTARGVSAPLNDTLVHPSRRGRGTWRAVGAGARVRTRGHAGTTSNKQMLGVGRRAAVRVSEQLVAQARARAQDRVCGQDERVGERTGWERGRAKDLPTWRMKMMIGVRPVLCFGPACDRRGEND